METKIKPGLSTFSSSPQKLETPLAVSSSTNLSYVVKSQHHQYPFSTFHGWNETLDLKDQRVILDTICDYLTRNSDFFISQNAQITSTLSTEVSVLRLVGCQLPQGSMDHPEEHQHGKVSHNLWSFGHGGDIGPGCFPAKFSRGWRNTKIISSA